ncbi:hypothetical protein [Staphylococcus xylosus]|uniref:hypothetical protein n=1 Tax=Staphylococcus xylosus TaxID=1288 RepID=UPI002DB76867|nr:hypothetical protein [Staphylococcus xylosus]MEB8101051.1 hypothetical protein [Staphylococcus xylosus]
MEFNEFKDRVSFLQYVNNGPYPEDEEKKELYSCYCKIYSSSMKDLEVLKNTESKSGFTIIIRDPIPQYLPKNNHYIRVNRPLYDEKLFNIVEIRLNTPQQGYLTLVLSEV